MKKKSSRSLHKSLHEAKVVVVVLPKLQKAEFSLRKSIMLTKTFFLPFFVACVFKKFLLNFFLFGRKIKLSDLKSLD